MFKFVKNSDINFNSWDECIHNASNGNIYGLTWYLDIIAPGWDAIIKKENDIYMAVFPLPYLKKWGFKYLIQPIFAQQLGLFYLECYPINEHDYEQIFETINKEFDMISTYNLNIQNVINKDIGGFKIEVLKTYHLDLSRSYENIKEKYKKDKKYRTSQTQKGDLEIHPSTNINGLIRMFNENTAYKIPGVKDNVKIHHTLKEVFQEASYHNMAKLFEVKNAQKETVAMACFLIYKRYIIYFFSAITPQGKKNQAIIHVLDYIIKQYSEKDMVLDFEGSHVPGIAEFYRSFGAEKKEFISLSKNNLPIFFNWIKKIKSGIYTALTS